MDDRVAAIQFSIAIGHFEREIASICRKVARRVAEGVAEGDGAETIVLINGLADDLEGDCLAADLAFLDDKGRSMVTKGERPLEGVPRTEGVAVARGVAAARDRRPPATRAPRCPAGACSTAISTAPPHCPPTPKP